MTNDTILLPPLLKFHDITHPQTREPYDDSLLFGLAGGIGFGYFLFQFSNYTALVIGTSHSWQDSKAMYEGLLQRLDVSYEIKESGGKKAAQKNLDDALDAGQPALIWTDRASLPHHHLPEHLKKSFIQLVGVLGRDKSGEKILLDDHSKVPFPIAPDVLLEARTVMPYNKTRVLTLVPGQAPAPDVEEAVRASIRLCCESALNPPIKNFGVDALDKWAKLLTKAKDKKGWPTAFPPGPVLYGACRDVYHNIETAGFGGGASRLLYADFLERHANLPAFAAKFREAAGLWTQLAHAFLPCEETRQLLQEKWALYKAQGPLAEAEFLACDARLAEVKARVGADFAHDLKPAQELLLEIHRFEKQTLEQLQKEVTA